MHHFDAYLALGDSMSIDEYAGPGLGAASLLFHNHDDLYPQFSGCDLIHANPTLRFQLLAKDGLDAPGLERMVQALTQGRLSPYARNALVTITIGGNDLLNWWASGIRTQRDASRRLKEFSARVDRIVELLRNFHESESPLIVIGNVYDPTDGSGRLSSGFSVLKGLPMLDAMNRAIEDLARRNEIRLVDIHGHFLGHGVRHADRDYPRYDSADPSFWYTYDIEPNMRGSSEIRRLFWNSLR